jgi:hypothetical protein
LTNPQKAKSVVSSILLEMDAVNLLLKYLYSIQRKAVILKSDIYNDFFEVPFIKQFLDRHGIEPASKEGTKHRIPFLFNILETIGIINQRTREIEILSFVLAKKVIRLNDKETEDIIFERIRKITQYIKLESYALGKAHAFRRGSIMKYLRSKSYMEQTF